MINFLGSRCGSDGRVCHLVWFWLVSRRCCPVGWVLVRFDRDVVERWMWFAFVLDVLVVLVLVMCSCVLGSCRLGLVGFSCGTDGFG